jgi:hypothetical protein
MKIYRILFVLTMATLCISSAQAFPGNENQQSAKFMEEVTSSVRGFVSVHYSNNKIFFEVPDSLLGRDMLIAVRASELSHNRRHVAAGQMRHNPMLIRFTADDDLIYLHQIVSSEYAHEDDPVRKSLDRNNLVPVIEAFKIIHQTEYSRVFDFTNYLKEPINPISPFHDGNRPGSLNAALTSFLSVKAFENNIEIKTRFGFRAREPFLAIMHRSFVLLPEEKMKPRLNDPRVGYFNESKRRYSSEQISVERYAYISRFNIQPGEEDIERYVAGELVEPVSPIVFYIDDAFPEKWRPYIKAGVEDWQLAFEAIGFKNAIVAKDFPSDDPDFDPDDIRYNTVRYVTTPSANAEGQKWTDPRSGEIIQADVIWYSNVTEKLYEWLFVQTAAANEAVRGREVADEVMGETIRYAAAHEIGHSLGLVHNFRAHYAFPVDSLRSARFTQQYGSCASIMDYARNNYIAQPGDKDIRFTPPIMGPYDYFAIKYGYKPIFEAETACEEKDILNNWILEKSHDPAYIFSRNQSSSDPASQSEALGNDVVRAGGYGAANIRIILENMTGWMEVENNDAGNRRLSSMHQALMRQYGQYFKHAYAQIGGMHEYLGPRGNEAILYEPLSRKSQQDALYFILQELSGQFDWMNPMHIASRIGSYESDIYDFQRGAMETLMSRDKFQHILRSSSLSDDPYTIAEYVNDLGEKIFTSQHALISKSVQNIQLEYVKQIVKILENKEDYIAVENQLMPALYPQIKTIRKDAEQKSKRASGDLANHYRYMLEILSH